VTTKAAADWWEQLREPFPESAIGKLPKLNCSACAQKKGGPPRDRHCDRHTVKKCSVCGGYLSEAHIHLDYVGHAATTDRLLKVDPEWTWRPMATEVDTGFPRFDAQGGMWILLTVKGVTRPGYGDGANPKEVISDAIRNAAMRFGVALDLWAKEDLQAQEDEPAAKKSPRSAPAATGKAQQPEPPRLVQTGSAKPSGDSELKLPPDQGDVISAGQVQRLWTIARKDLKLTDESVAATVVAITGQKSTRAIPAYLYDKVVEELHTLAAASKL
jgi:hypothetical protein